MGVVTGVGRTNVGVGVVTVMGVTTAEDVQITYSYWDGSGHRRSVTVSHLKVVYHTHCCHDYLVDAERQHNSSVPTEVSGSPQEGVLRTEVSHICWKIVFDLRPLHVQSMLSGQLNVHQGRPYHPTGKG